MSEHLVPIIIVPAIFFSIVAMIKIVSDNMVRRRLVEKGIVDENVKYLYTNSLSNQTPSSLKWGMVLIAVGVAVLIGQLVPHSFAEEATISCMFILAGLALILYYFIGSRIVRKQEESQPGT